MLILRDQNGKVTELPISIEQYQLLQSYIVSGIECISCELHKEEHSTPSPKKPHFMRNKYVHILIHIVLAMCVLFPFVASHFHLDSGILIGVGSLYTGIYSTFFAYKMDREGVKVK
jgi:hypothetical protein